MYSLLQLNWLHFCCCCSFVIVLCVWIACFCYCCWYYFCCCWFILTGNLFYYFTFRTSFLHFHHLFVLVQVFSGNSDERNRKCYSLIKAMWRKSLCNLLMCKIQYEAKSKSAIYVFNCFYYNIFNIRQNY